MIRPELNEAEMVSVKAHWHTLCVVMCLWPTLNQCIIRENTNSFLILSSVHAYLHYQWIGGPWLLL